MSQHSSDKDEKALGAVHKTDSPIDDKPALPLRVSVNEITTGSLLLGLAICMGGFLFGYDIGVISGCLVMPDFVRRFGGVVNPATGELALPDDVSSLITATLSVGTFVGALAQAPVSDAFGRKISMIVWALFFLVGAVVQTSAMTEVGQLYGGRVLAGLGVGALSGLCPLYLSETAPKAVRGLMISCYQLMIILGICVSYGITWASNNRNEDQVGWRIPIGFQILWAVLLIALMLPLPESPRWLLQRGRDEQCRRVMAKMRGTQLENTADGLRGSAALEQDFDDMAEGIRAEANAFAGTNWFTAYALCFTNKHQMWRRTGTAMLMQMLQQLNGQNFYYYYGPIFFSKANVQLQPLQIQFIFGIVSLICTVPALYLIERVGRRKMLISGALLEGSCAFLVAFVGRYALAPTGATPTASQLAAGRAFVAFAVLHLATYSMTWGPVPWALCGELFPQHLRAKSISLASASNWLWNFLLSFFSNKIASQYGTFIMLIFGSVLFTAALIVWAVVPELKGLTLEQVDEMFEDRSVRPWHSAKWMPTTGAANRDTLNGMPWQKKKPEL